ASNALHGQTQLECARPTRIGFAALAALLLAAPTALASGAALTAEVDTLAGVEYHVTRKFGSFRFLRVDAPTRRQRGAIPLSRLLAAASEVIPDLERRLGLVARGEHFVLDSLY